MTTKTNPLADYHAFLADRARLARNPDVKLAYEKAANHFRTVDAAVADLVECADTVAHYDKFTAADDEYIEIPRGTMKKLIAALAAFEEK